MGERGPVPKRSSQRRRRNEPADGSIDTAPAAKVKPVAPGPDGDWHPIAARWYVALGESGQSGFYEPSDWAQAFFVAEAMSRLLAAGRFSAQLFSAVDSATVRLLATEADRRRLRIELEREQASDPDEDAADATVTDLMSRMRADGA
jgi:hypothetical protein